MAILVLIRDEVEQGALVARAYDLAKARKETIHIVIAIPDNRAAKGLPSHEDVKEGLLKNLNDAASEYAELIAALPDSKEGASEASLPYVEYQAVRYEDLEKSVFTCMKQEKIQLLIVSKIAISKSKGERDLLVERLLQEGSAHVLLLRPDTTQIRKPKRILVSVSGGPHASLCLKLAAGMLDPNDGVLIALHVGSDTMDLADEYAEAILKKALRLAAIDERVTVLHKLAFGSDVKECIIQEAKEGVDLVLLGASDRGKIKRILFGTIPDSLLMSEEMQAVGVVCKAHPLFIRMQRQLENWIDCRIPEMSRDDRLSLFERLQTGSKWNFDFLSLISLSTSIAALGLVQNSTAVVIGAMLVAPLMTPLLGAGLALVQGNTRLLANSIRSVIMGFSMSLGLGVLIGFLSGIVIPGTEILGRGHPTLLDLAVAGLSGIAAAYCSSRPGLSAALPGVAIAAALVPPIASSGIALSLGMYDLARGAALLFGTNVTAIICGASFCFYLAGVRGQSSEGGPHRVLWRGVLFSLLLCAILAVPLSGNQHKVHRLGAKDVGSIVEALDTLDARLISAVKKGVGDTRILELSIARASTLSQDELHVLEKVLREQGFQSKSIRIQTLLEQRF